MSAVVEVSSPLSPGTAGAYQARRSNKAARNAVAADGAVWKERLTVCEGVTDDGNPKITIRSYYRNQITQERVWDEPPSGASEVIFASSEQRKKADLQKQEMQLTLDELPPDMASLQHLSTTSATALSSSDSTTTSKKKGAKSSGGGGLFGRFKKVKEPTVLQDESKDLNLQRAIALSVAEAHGKKRSSFTSSDPVTLHDMGGAGIRRNLQQDDDEDVALAKALSMSAAKAEALQPAGLTEDELLRQALKASRLDEHRVPTTTFDPYAPGGTSSSSSTKSTRRHHKSNKGMMPPHKMEADQDKKKPARSMKRRVLGGGKTMANKAGVV